MRGAQLSAGYTVNTASLLCMTLVKAMSNAEAAENQRVGKTRRRSIYSADRQTRSQSDSTQLKTGNFPMFLCE